MDAEVTIIGAGPVGLVLAAELARKGRTVVVVEQRSAGEAPSPKCNHISARSMEILRRLGVADQVRAVGLPDEFPHDVSYRTASTGTELTRILIPGRNGRKRSDPGPDTNWPTAEPPHRVNQIFFEPVLFEFVSKLPNVTILNRMQALSFEQDDEGVSTLIEDMETHARRTLRSRFMIGCDGGRSPTRKAIGAKFEGDAVVQRVQSTFIRGQKLLGMLTAGPAWAMFTMNPRRSGNVYAIDGSETWLIHNYLRPDEADFDSVDRDRCIRDILGVDDAFEYEVLSYEDWYGRRLVADRFRDRRVFICGDAAHIWVPYAGYGMNAGIADAENLAWLLAANLAGWGGDAILDAHEAERKPITEQVSHFAMNHAHAMAKQRAAVPADIEEPGPHGDAVRTEVGKRAYDLNVQQYCCGGLNFGYYYDQSPIVAYDDEAAPAYGMADFTPSTVPGCRLAHFFTSDGLSVYDMFGDGYALLRMDNSVPIGSLLAAARRRNTPLTVIDLAGQSAPAAYRHKLIIARPDGHVAWRGDALPDDVDGLLRVLTGAASGRIAAKRASAQAAA
ncbi:MAG: FAD-dependent oxidoreductase [Rhizobiaceae bacterium]